MNIILWVIVALVVVDEALRYRERRTPERHPRHYLHHPADIREE